MKEQDFNRLKKSVEQMVEMENNRTSTTDLTALADRLEKALDHLGKIPSVRSVFAIADHVADATREIHLAIAALRAGDGERWQLIETAPKDRPILICWGTITSGPQGVLIGYWSARHSEWIERNYDAIESDGHVALKWHEIPELPTPPTN
jgi:hypothetical protein